MDSIRVAATQSHEVRYLRSQYPALSYQAVVGAVKAAGPMRKKIKAYIKQKYGL